MRLAAARARAPLRAMDGAPWTLGDPSFTFSETELVDVLHLVSGLTEGAQGASRQPCWRGSRRSDDHSPRTHATGKLAASRRAAPRPPLPPPGTPAAHLDPCSLCALLPQTARTRAPPASRCRALRGRICSCSCWARLPRRASSPLLAATHSLTRPRCADGTTTAHGLQFQPRQRGDAGAFAAGLQFRPHDPGASTAHLLAAGDDAPATYSPAGSGEEGGAAAAAYETGPKVSHGASEKQCRDRINAMIDQLRVIGAYLRVLAMHAPILTRGTQCRAMRRARRGGRVQAETPAKAGAASSSSCSRPSTR